MDAKSWRTQLLPDAREKIVNSILETLVKNYPSSQQWVLSEISKIAVRFEERIYNTAISQKDYIQRITVKMSSIHTLPLNTATNVSSSDADTISTDLGSEVKASRNAYSEVLEQEQSPLAPSANPSQAHKKVLSQNLKSTMETSRGQSSIGLSSVVPQMTSLTKIPKPKFVGQDVKFQSLSGSLPSLVNKSVGEEVSSNNAANSWIPVQEQEDLVKPVIQQQFQNSHQFFCKQHQTQSQKINPESIKELGIQTPHAQKQQQQQQTFLQPNQLLSSQQSIIQTSPIMDISVTESAPCFGLPQGQQSSVQQPTKSVLQQHPESVFRQQHQPSNGPVIHHQRTVMKPPDGLAGQEAKHSFFPKLPLVSGQTNNQPKQQQQQQLVRLSDVSGLKERKLLGGQSDDSCAMSNLLSIPMSQQANFPMKQPIQQTALSSSTTKGQQSQPQPSEIRLNSENQLQTENLRQNPSSSEKNMQQLLQTSSSLLQPQMLIQFQSQQVQPDASSIDHTSEIRHANFGDWQEELYQKIKGLKDMYLSKVIQIYNKLGAKYQQLVSHPQRPMSNQSRKLKYFMSRLEFLINFLQVPQSRISLAYKEQVEKVENFIIDLVHSNPLRKSDSIVQNEELPMLDIHSLQQSVLPQSQTLQVKSDFQPVKLQSPAVSSMQKNNANTLKNDHISALSGVATAPKNIMNRQLPATKSKTQQLHAVKQLQQDSLNIPVSSPQQSMNSASLSQNIVNIPQQNTHSLKSNSSMLQQKHLKQQQEQEIVDVKPMTQQLEMQQQQLLKMKEQIMQQQQPAQDIYRMPQNKMDKDDLKVKQNLNLVPGILPRGSTSPHSAYNQHQLKSRGSLVSLPQLQPVSHQVPQSSFPQIDQKNMILSSKKMNTSLKTVNSMSIVSSPSTPFSQSPMLGEIGGQQETSPMGLATSLIISPPQISCSPLIEAPIQRLIGMVKSISNEALTASVNDIKSVVFLTDGTAGSLSGKGAVAAIGEDLSATAGVSLKARDFGNQDGTIGRRKMNRSLTAAPLRILSGGVTHGIKQFTGSETSSNMEDFSEIFRLKKPKTETNHALLKEIREINQQLINTVVDLSEEDMREKTATAATGGGEGTIVKCSFSAVVASLDSKSRQASERAMPILPLHLLVPTKYPSCSPMLLDKLPVVRGGDFDDLSEKAKLQLSSSLKNIMKPISLGEIARAWDDCARRVICEYAQQNGGGSFSTTYGAWENTLSAA